MAVFLFTPLQANPAERVPSNATHPQYELVILESSLLAPTFKLGATFQTWHPFLVGLVDVEGDHFQKHGLRSMGVHPSFRLGIC